VTYAKALVAVLVVSVLSTAIALAAARFFGLGSLPFYLAYGSASLACSVTAVEVLGRGAPGRALLAWLIWNGLGAVYAVLFVLVIRFTWVEFFINPTGAMADTLLGDHKTVVCPQCGYTFAVNASMESNPQAGSPIPVVGCTCPNCRFHCALGTGGMSATIEGGDRVCVAKGLANALLPTQRWDLVVFQFPGDDSVPGGPMSTTRPGLNYPKRVVGLPGETIGIWQGKLYALPGGQPEAADRAAPPDDLRKPAHLHEDESKELLERQDPAFAILRKRPDQVLALRRLVYDNDHPAQDLVGKLAPRWAADAGASWEADAAQRFHHPAGQGDDVAWLRYRHILRASPVDAAGKPRPELITDFLGYNTYEPGFGGPVGRNWVGDLMLECEVTTDQPSGELVLELSKGVDRFQARWDLASAACTLVRLGKDKPEEQLDRKPTAVRPGTHRLRFSNVDERLLVWVDSDLPFGDGVPYPPARQQGPVAENDLQPASIGARGAGVDVRHLRLWRDTYYTLDPRSGSDARWEGDDWADPQGWGPLQHLLARTLYVHPDHYFCVGDNSTESSDSRTWGLVPKRLMLGRALFIYYPADRVGLIR
jgi:signal peptidase I